MSLTGYSCILLALSLRVAESSLLQKTIAEIIPEHVKRSVICLVNTNMTFDFPAARFHGKSGLFWTNPGKARVMPSLYLIELRRTEEDLESVLYDLHKNMVFEPRATYILALTGEVNSKPLLDALKKFFISEAIAVTPDGRTYRYDWKLQHLRSVSKENVTFRDVTQSQLTDTTNVTLKVGFMRKPPFVICPECARDRGIEIETFDLAAAHLNIKVDYVPFRTTYWGEKLNGSYTFLYKEIFDRNFDVGFGQTFDFDDCHYDFDLTPIHIIDAMQFVVPKARRIGQFNLFGYVFKRETLLVYILVQTFVFLVTCIINHWKSKLDKLLQLLQIVFEVSFDMRGVRRSASRCLYGFFLFSTVIFNTGLKSQLFRSLTMEHFEYQINSLEDIIPSNLIPVFNNHSEGYFDRDTPVDKFMDTNSPRTCGFELTCVDHVAFYRNVTTMKMKKALEYYSPRKYVDENGKALIHIINVDIQKLYLRFFFVKGHPAFPRFSRAVTSLIENGINDYIGDKLSEGNRKAQVKAEMNYHAISVNKLDVMQLLNVVYIYIGGIGISFVVFFVERAWYRKH